MFKVNKLAKPQYQAQRDGEGGVQTDRQTELLPSDVSDGPIWFRSVLQSIISKTWSLCECPHQLDMMTKTLWVRDDKFPWLCALKFILHSYRWISPVFPSLFNGADKWSVAVIQSISCLSGRDRCNKRLGKLGTGLLFWKHQFGAFRR